MSAVDIDMIFRKIKKFEMPNNYKSSFLSIICIALISRIIICFYSNLSWYTTDTYYYLKMADGILNGSPLSYFPNGYPLLIVLFKLFLPNLIIPIVLIITNITFQLLTLFLIERILNNFNISEQLRLISLFIVALYPNQLNYTRQLLTEASSLFFLTLTIFLYSNQKNLLAGFLGHLTAQFRPTLWPYLPIIILFELLKKNYKASLTLFFGFLIGVFVFFALENLEIIKPPNNLGLNLLISIQSDSYDIEYSIKNFSKEEQSSPLKTYIYFALNNPYRFLEQRLISLWVLWGPMPISNRGFFEKLLIAVRFPLFIISILTIIFYKKIGLQKDFVLIISLPIIIITAIHTMFFSQQRFTFVVEPFIIILSVLFIDYIVKILFKKSLPRFN